MEDAARYDWLVAMNAGQVLATGTPAELLERTGTENPYAAFIALLPAEARSGHRAVEIQKVDHTNTDYAIKAQGLTMRFGDFTAVDNVSFQIPKGKIFGFLGSNGCGKSTTMKMLTGLSHASEGTAKLFGAEVDPGDISIRKRVGYMSRAFSLYTELTVEMNLDLHARLFKLDEAIIPGCIRDMATRFDLTGDMDSRPDALQLGIRQRLSLAVEMIHSPDILILDELTSGVDPVRQRLFDPRRMFRYAMRETMELRRDPIRATLAILGSVILMIVIGLGIYMDVEDLTFAVLDNDISTISRDYVAQIAGSRYFISKNR